MTLIFTYRKFDRKIINTIKNPEQESPWFFGFILLNSLLNILRAPSYFLAC